MATQQHIEDPTITPIIAGEIGFVVVGSALGSILGTGVSRRRDDGSLVVVPLLGWLIDLGEGIILDTGLKDAGSSLLLGWWWLLGLGEGTSIRDGWLLGLGEGRTIRDGWLFGLGEGTSIRDGWLLGLGEGRTIRDGWLLGLGEGRTIRDGWLLGLGEGTRDGCLAGLGEGTDGCLLGLGEGTRDGCLLGLGEGLKVGLCVPLLFCRLVLYPMVCWQVLELLYILSFYSIVPLFLYLLYEFSHSGHGQTLWWKLKGVIESGFLLQKTCFFINEVLTVIQSKGASRSA